MAPPSFDALLSEAALHGAVVHAHSWGDATTEYTSRSETLDRWSLEHPWTLAFIAPGNGGQVLEPANALNAVAVGATTVGTPDERWVGSPDGPTVLDTDGIGLLAPGSHIVSAKADGDPESLNGEWQGLKRDEHGHAHGCSGRGRGAADDPRRVDSRRFLKRGPPQPHCNGTRMGQPRNDGVGMGGRWMDALGPDASSHLGPQR